MSLRVYSDLISSRDNALLFSLLGPKCSVMASAVAQVYVGSMEPRGHEATWRCAASGVVCLVNDQSLHSYYLRLYSVKRAKLLWEQELYIPFRYSAPRPFFHTFPADDFQAGLNFADEAEAEEFLSAVRTHIKSARDEDSSAEMTHDHTLEPFSEQVARSMSNKSESNLNYSNNNPEKSFNGNTLGPAQQTVIVKAGINDTVLKRIHISRNPPMAEHQGGLKAAQKGSQSHQPQSPPKCRRAVSSLALTKGPLPPLPAQARLPPARESQSMSQNIRKEGPFSATPVAYDAIPPPPSMPAPRLPALSAVNRK
ncbi:actin nucleation-promoting factor WASL [Conger conger]|uniref:actin nucleation-promoting factor WASL n=1 Tax=Conger conger TaxID=82655 RepID=UPI002A5AE048|nr:actin nucleation-promoting factor WASL [Conger conger]